MLIGKRLKVGFVPRLAVGCAHVYGIQIAGHVGYRSRGVVPPVRLAAPDDLFHMLTWCPTVHPVSSWLGLGSLRGHCIRRGAVQPVHIQRHGLMAAVVE